MPLTMVNDLASLFNAEAVPLGPANLSLEVLRTIYGRYIELPAHEDRLIVMIDPRTQKVRKISSIDAESWRIAEEPPYAYGLDPRRYCVDTSNEIPHPPELVGLFAGFTSDNGSDATRCGGDDEVPFQ